MGAEMDDHLEYSQQADGEIEAGRRDLQLTTVDVITFRPGNN